MSFSILILISKFWRQMRYHWNRHHSYIVNIVFSNNLVQKQSFFIFCIFVFIRYKGSPLGRVFLDRLYKSQRHGTSCLTACATEALNFEAFWPRVHLQISISRVVDRVCKSSAPSTRYRLRNGIVENYTASMRLVREQFFLLAWGTSAVSLLRTL